MRLTLIKTLRKGSYLFITTIKPHEAVSKDTISRWLKTILQRAGIDTSVYKGHSTRTASTSAANAAGIPINIIMEKAGWSKENTFAKLI